MLKPLLTLILAMTCAGLVQASPGSAASRIQRGAYRGAAGAVSAGAPQRQAGAPLRIKGGPELWGAVEYSTEWESLEESERPYGMYSFTAGNPSAIRLLADLRDNMPNGSGAIIDNVFHYINYTVMYETQVVSYYHRISTETWQSDTYPMYQYASTVASDIAYDPTTGTSYGYFYSPTDMNQSNTLCSVTYDTYGPQVYNICQEEKIMIAVACDDNGQLYGLDSEGGFYRIDKYSGEKTLVDYTGALTSTYSQSAAFDSRSGKIYWTAFHVDDQGAKSGLYEIDPATGVTTLVGSFDNSLEISNLYIPAPAADDDAPAAATDLTASFVKGALEGSVSFNLPSKTYGDEPLSGSLDYKVYVNGVEKLSGKADAGSKVTCDMTLENGITEIYVTSSNQAGVSPASEKISFFAGFDVPGAVRDISLSIDADRQATLTWSDPEGTVNNGYLDTENLTFDIVRYPGGAAVATGVKGHSFAEQLSADGMAAYSYGITANHHGLRGEEAVSEKVIIGEAFNTPFIDNFSNDDLYDLYKVVTLSEGSPSWSPSNKSFVIFYTWNPSDSWLLTPPVRLSAGKTYHFTYAIRTASNYDDERFATAYGTGDDPTAYTTLREPLVIKSSEYTYYTDTFTPASDGNYRLGIHACSDGFKSGMYVTDITVRQDAAADVPEAAADLVLVPGERGAASVTGRFKAPAADINGNDLESILKIEVVRGDETVVKVFDNPAPGAELEFTDTDMAPGMTSYKVTAVNAIGKGKEAVAETWTGIDIPLAPANVAIEETANGFRISWEAPAATGVHDGWVDTEAVTYNIYDALGEPAVTDVKGNSFSFSFDMSAPNVLFFNVTANTVNGESEHAATPDLVIGTPATLPFEESFKGGQATFGNLWWTRGNISINHFAFAVDKAADNDGGSAYWYPMEANDFAWLNSGRISANGAKNATLMFSYYSTPGHQLGIEAVADIQQQNQVVLASRNCSDDTGEAGWRQVIVSLPAEVVEAPWFLLRFRAFGDKVMGENEDDHVEQPFIHVDAIRLVDFPDADATVSLTAPSLAVYGSRIDAEITVSNIGLADMSVILVELLVDGQPVSSKTMASLPFNTQDKVTLGFTPAVGTPDNFELTARITTAADDVADNNVSAAHPVQVAASSLNTVSDLTVDSSDPANVLLRWSDPSLQPHKVVENFDHYTPWLTESAGGWTMFDGDGVVTNAYTSMYYPHIGEPLSFMVFNNDYATMADVQEPIFTPLSGNQCMLAVANVHEYGKGIECEDWLISPELSGEAQTIEFHTKTLTDYEEDFAIYTSTTDNSVESLRPNRLVFEKFGAGNQWRTHTYELPAGTRYFAIVYTSNLSGLMIDDITFNAKPLTLTGYNIYRDGVQAGTVDARTTSWPVSKADASTDHIYQVTAIYAEGESGFSNEVHTGESSIIDIDTDSSQMGDVFTITGINLGKVDPRTLRPGIYIVDGRKVYVK